MSWLFVFTLPSGCTATATGLERWLPAAVLGKTANRRSNRPWANARHHLHQSTTAAGCHQLGNPVLNKHSWPTFSRSSSEYDRPLFTCPHRGGKLDFFIEETPLLRLRNLDFPRVAKSGTGTGGLNSNDLGSGARPLTARSLSASIRAERRAREREDT